MRLSLNAHLMRVVYAVLLIAFMSSCAYISCAYIDANKRLKEYEELLVPMLGSASREDIVRKFGAPHSRQSIGSIELWIYYESLRKRRGADVSTHDLFGKHRDAYVSPYDQYWTRSGTFISPHDRYGSFASTQSNEACILITLTFNADGILGNWKAYVKRERGWVLLQNVYATQ